MSGDARPPAFNTSTRPSNRRDSTPRARPVIDGYTHDDDNEEEEEEEEEKKYGGWVWWVGWSSRLKEDESASFARRLSWIELSWTGE